MPAQKQKWSVMPTYSQTISGFVAVLVLVLSTLTASAASPKYRSPQDALEQGIGAYNGGYYEIAVPALNYANDAHLFLAPYYLARIYSDNNGPLTDHAKAYELYLKIAEEHTDVDPDDDQRAPYVAKAMTQIAGYLMTGLPEVGLKSNPRIAAEYLREAAQFFRDEDAQFELAKLYLRGEGIESDVPYAKHWLSVLSQKGHAGAQAFLADLLWRGKYMKADPVRALALISVAVANAPPYERVWIEDIYQNIYCGAAQGIRKQATGLVADWRTRYGRKPDLRDHSGLGTLTTQAIRTCRNGEAVPFEMGVTSAEAAQPAASPPVQPFLKGPAGVGLRDVDASVSSAPAH
jgi:exopolysaccharide production negative regulator